MFCVFIYYFFTAVFSVFKMPRFYRYSSRRYRRYGGRYWRRNWWRRGVSRAQKQGTRRFGICIPIEGAGSVSVSGGATNSAVFGFNPFFNSNRGEGTATRLNSYGSLIGNDLFTTYTNLYDEVKVNSVYIELAIANTVGTSNAIKVVSSVDRHATLSDINQVANLSQLSAAAESDCKMFTSLTYAKVSRYFRARDRQESTIFVDSSLGTVQPEGTYTNAGLKEFLENGNLYGAFNPLVRFGFMVGAAPLAAATVGFQYRVLWNLTFRNPKYGQNVSFQRSMRSVGEGVDEVVKSVDDEVLPDVEEDTKKSSKKFDELSDEEKAKIMELIGTMEDEKGA